MSKCVNFANKVTVLSTPKLSGRNNVSGATAQHRARIQFEINRHKVNIDKTVFEKSQAEKDVLKMRKNDHSCHFDGNVAVPFQNKG